MQAKTVPHPANRRLDDKGTENFNRKRGVNAKGRAIFLEFRSKQVLTTTNISAKVALVAANKS